MLHFVERRKMIVSFLIVSSVCLLPLNATNISAAVDGSVIESRSPDWYSSSLIPSEEIPAVRRDIHLINRNITVGGGLSSAYLTEKSFIFRQWNKSGLRDELNHLFLRISADDYVFTSNSESCRQDGYRRWIVPVMITICAGATVYALYSVRGR